MENLTEAEKRTALFGELSTDEIPEENSGAYMDLLEKRILSLMEEMKQMDLRQRTQDRENTLLQFFAKMKTMSQDGDSTTGPMMAQGTGAIGGGVTGQGGSRPMSSSPDVNLSIRDSVLQANGDCSKLYAHNHVPGTLWNKMSFRDLMLGFWRVSLYVEELGISMYMYKKHVEYIAEIATANCYTTEAFLRYEFYVTTQVIEGKVFDWSPSDSHAQNFYFNRIYS